MDELKNLIGKQHFFRSGRVRFFGAKINEQVIQK
jgi:hypothetical protein